MDLHLLEQAMRQRAQVRRGIGSPRELAGDCAQDGRAHADHARRVDGGHEARHEIAVPDVDATCQGPADELLRGVAPESGQLAAEHLLEGLAHRLCEQGVLPVARQALEQRLRAHGAGFGKEPRLRRQPHRRMGPGVLRAAPRPMGGKTRLHVYGVARIQAAVAAFQHVHVVLKGAHRALPLPQPPPIRTAGAAAGHRVARDPIARLSSPARPAPRAWRQRYRIARAGRMAILRHRGARPAGQQLSIATARTMSTSAWTRLHADKAKRRGETWEFDMLQGLRRARRQRPGTRCRQVARRSARPLRFATKKSPCSQNSSRRRRATQTAQRTHRLPKAARPNSRRS